MSRKQMTRLLALIVGIILGLIVIGPLLVPR